MKKIYIALAIMAFGMISCNSSKVSAEENSKGQCALEKVGYSKEEITQRLDDLWAHFFTPGDFSKFKDDDQTTVYYEVGDSMAFIYDTGSEDVRTEGMSYGMMISVQMDKQETFDKLWRWAKTYMAYPADSPWDGYFCWQCKADGTRFGNSNASDGEIYFATALFRAADKWGDEKYAQEANTMLRKVMEKDSTSGVYPLYDKDAHLVTFCPTPDAHWFSDPSYCLPAFLDYWAEKADTLNDFWKKAADVARDHLAAASHPTTGLFPDYSNYDGSPYSWPRCGYNSARYQYDAIRCAMNVGMDYYMTGKDKKRQHDMMVRMLKFFDEKDYNFGQCNLDGSEPENTYTEGMAGANAVGAIALLDSEDEAERALGKKVIDKFWNTPAPTGQWRYYTGMVYFLSMLHVSTNY